MLSQELLLKDIVVVVVIDFRDTDGNDLMNDDYTEVSEELAIYRSK